MKFLVIGQGGREHAIVKALSRSPSVTQIHAIPGNNGMAREAICHDMNWQDFENLTNFCHRMEIDCVVIGPENPLVDGLSDRLRERGVIVFGPSAEAAQLEGSKIYAKRFMEQVQAPTARYAVVKSVQDVENQLSSFTPPYVLKADGLAGGKGVYICKDKAELMERSRDLFEKKVLGDAGKQALLEQFQPGWEMSYLVLTNGSEFAALPVAQDHKRLKDQDAGPNTGGMGTLAPVPVSPDLQQKIDEQIVRPTVEGLKKNALIYRGVIFIGLMITEDGPKILEYNVRFGDPETQVILPLIENDWGQVFYEVACGRLPKIRQRNVSACCVVLAAPGYPDAPQKGVRINGDPTEDFSSSYFLHAGTTRSADGQWLVNGGRALNAVGIGSTPQEAIQHAYQLSEKVSWDGLQKRSDIGAKITNSSAHPQR